MPTQGKETTWSNADGLQVGFGTRTTTNDEEYSIRTVGNSYILEVPLNSAKVLALGTSFAGDVGQGYRIPVPKHAVITKAQFFVSTAFTSGGSATLSIGLYSDDGDSTSTAIDADGIDATVAVAALDADAVIDCDGALVNGDNIGAADGYVEFIYGTAAFTAGAGVLRIEYVKPSTFTNAL